MESYSPMMRRLKLQEELGKIRRWKEEGKSKEEVLSLINRQVATDEDVEEIYKDQIKEENIPEPEENKETKNDNQEEKAEESEAEIEKNITEENKSISEEKEDKEEKIQELKEEYKELTDEELVDFPEQPFKLYDDEQKQEMINSIRINGIIQPLIVRPLENGKYQILSGHNRRICGKEAGLEKFPCKIKYGLTDDEAKLYLVDTNLATRNKISPMERAKALLIRRNAYKLGKVKLRIEEGIMKDNLDNVDVRKKIQEIENMSNGNVQRYLRLNYLSENLQDLADNGKINLKVAENLSFLPKDKQRQIGNMITKDNIKISEGQSKKIKEQTDLNMDQIKEMFQKKEKEKIEINIKFTKEEIEKYFENFDVQEIKAVILKALEKTKQD